MRIQAEYVSRHGPKKKVFEVDRTASGIDKLWHVPIANRTPISREIEIPAINYFDKPRWTLTAVGYAPKRSDRFWFAHTHLRDQDYFPVRGDYIFWNGYRYAMIDVVIDPKAYWQQTNVWLGLYVECAIVPEGDQKPLQDVSKVAKTEVSSTSVLVPGMAKHGL